MLRNETRQVRAMLLVFCAIALVVFLLRSYVCCFLLVVAEKKYAPEPCQSSFKVGGTRSGRLLRFSMQHWRANVITFFMCALVGDQRTTFRRTLHIVGSTIG